MAEVSFHSLVYISRSTGYDYYQEDQSDQKNDNHANISKYFPNTILEWIGFFIRRFYRF